MSDLEPLKFPTGSDPALVTLSKINDVFLLTMSAMPDNRFNPAMVHALTQALDHVEEYAYPKTGPSRPCALVTTSASPKFFSNGLDIKYLFQSGDTWFISDKFLAVLKRVLLFPVMTVAAINGHCFAGGLLFALCHDFRVLRSDKGLLSMNEIDLPSSLHPGMAAIVRSKLPRSTLHPLIFGPKRYGGQDAVAAGLVNSISSEHDLIPSAFALAHEHTTKSAKAGRIITNLKVACYQDIVDALDIRYPIDVREFMKPKL